jgi:hypothetical protein
MPCNNSAVRIGEEGTIAERREDASSTSGNPSATAGPKGIVFIDKGTVGVVVLEISQGVCWLRTSGEAGFR